MPDTDPVQADLAALNNLIVNCPDFDRLEEMLGGFNLFQVLKFEHGEIRHSNVLAWILDPNESHGLDATFLKKWLMRVIHESSTETKTAISPIDIDAWQLAEVEVRREWQNIDILVILTFSNGKQWVVCIENKIHSTQHSNQLHRYRRTVESHFPEVTHQLFIFLTKSDEQPEDENYITASYTQVHQALKESIQSRNHAIGNDPKVLLENYLRLLEEKFMDESEIARTALRIYQQHRRALDIIFEQRPDNLRLASDGVRAMLEKHAPELGIVMAHSTKSYVRFLPKEWYHPGNCHGNAWAGVNHTVLFEMSFGGRRPYLYIMSGKAPESWIAPMWDIAAKPPFKRPAKAKRPKMWCALHSIAGAEVLFEEGEMGDSGETIQRIFDWTKKAIEAPETKEMISIITSQLPALDEAYKALGEPSTSSSN